MAEENEKEDKNKKKIEHAVKTLTTNYGLRP